MTPLVAKENFPLRSGDNHNVGMGIVEMTMLINSVNSTSISLTFVLFQGSQL